MKPHTIYDFYIKFRHKVEHIADRHFNRLPLSGTWNLFQVPVLSPPSLLQATFTLRGSEYSPSGPFNISFVGFVPFFNCRENLVWLRWNCVQLPMFSPNQFYEFALQKSMQWHTFYNRLRLITQMGYNIPNGIYIGSSKIRNFLLNITVKKW